MDVMEWAKANVKDGANLAELEELVVRSNPISKIKTKEDAEVFIRGNDIFRSALDSVVSKSVENHDKKFAEEKLPNMLKEEREKIRQELNPKETDEQRAIREIREENQKLRTSIAKKDLVGELRAVNADYKFPDEVVDSFADYGETAVDRFHKLGEYVKGRIAEGIEAGVKSKFQGSGPPAAGNRPTGKTMSRADFDRLSPVDKAKVAVDGTHITD